MHPRIQTILEKFASSGELTFDEAGMAEALILGDDQVDDAERNALKSAVVEAPEKNDPNHIREKFKLLAQSQNRGQYVNALRFGNFSTLAPQLYAIGDLECVTEESRTEFKRDMCPTTIPLNKALQLTWQDAAALPLSDGSQSQWDDLCIFLRNYVETDPDAVRTFLTELQLYAPEYFDRLLSTANIHFEGEEIKQDPLYAMARREAFIARVQGTQEQRDILHAKVIDKDGTQQPLTDDFSIPLIIRHEHRGERPNRIGVTFGRQKYILSGDMVVKAHILLNRLNDIDSFSETVKHEMRHANFAVFRGKTYFDTLPSTISEGLANYFDQNANQADLKKLLMSMPEEDSRKKIEKIYQGLLFNLPSTDEHEESDIFFYFIEERYGLEKMRQFVAALFPDNQTPSKFDRALLEKAAQTLKNEPFTWRELLEDFRYHAHTSLEKLKQKEGGNDFSKIIQEVFRKPLEALNNTSKADLVGQLTPDEKTALLKACVAFTEAHPISIYTDFANYIIGITHLSQKDYSQARIHLRQSKIFVTGCTYGIALSYVMEGKYKQAEQVLQKASKKDPEMKKALEDLTNNNGARIKNQFLLWADQLTAMPAKFVLE